MKNEISLLHFMNGHVHLPFWKWHTLLCLIFFKDFFFISVIGSACGMRNELSGRIFVFYEIYFESFFGKTGKILFKIGIFEAWSWQSSFEIFFSFEIFLYLWNSYVAKGQSCFALSMEQIFSMNVDAPDLLMYWWVLMDFF